MAKNQNDFISSLDKAVNNLGVNNNYETVLGLIQLVGELAGEKYSELQKQAEKYRQQVLQCNEEEG